MKKLLSLLVAVLILLALCACKEDGSSAKTPEKKSGSDQATDPTDPVAVPAELYWADGLDAIPADDSADWKDAANAPAFTDVEFEPGYVEMRYFKIVGTGADELKYTLYLEPEADGAEVSDDISIYCIDTTVASADCQDLQEHTPVGTLTDVIADDGQIATGLMRAQSPRILAVAFQMHEDAGDASQGKTVRFRIRAVVEALNAEIYWAADNDGASVQDIIDWKDGFSTTLFAGEAMFTPGTVVLRHIKITNTGTTGLKYAFSLETVGAISPFAESIRVYCVDPDTQTPITIIGTLAELLDTNKQIAGGEFLPGTDHYVTLAFGVSKDALQEDLTEHIDCGLILSTEPVDS